MAEPIVDSLANPLNVSNPTFDNTNVYRYTAPGNRFALLTENTITTNSAFNADCRMQIRVRGRPSTNNGVPVNELQVIGSLNLPWWTSPENGLLLSPGQTVEFFFRTGGATGQVQGFTLGWLLEPDEVEHFTNAQRRVGRGRG